jgi:hypothetical protein
MDDGLMMRILADSPGGLELHIGVSLKHTCFHCEEKCSAV